MGKDDRREIGPLALLSVSGGDGILPRIIRAVAPAVVGGIPLQSRLDENVLRQDGYVLGALWATS